MKVWRLLFIDLCPSLVVYFDDARKRLGALGLISYFNGIAGHIINNSEPGLVESEFVYALRSETDIKTALQLLRFGKRYTPESWDDEMTRQVLASFHSRNNRAKQLDQRELPSWFVQIAKPIGEEIFRSVLKGATFEESLADRTFEGDWDHMPNGATAEGLHNEFEKWVALNVMWGQYPDELRIMEGAPRVGDDTSALASKMVLVPKDIRGPRVIMEEHLEVTERQTVVANGLYSILETPSFSKFSPYGHVTLNDQTGNQEMAIFGSASGYLATIDLSNASDCITARLLYAVLPDDVAHAIVEGATKFVELPDGTVTRCYIVCTMGSRVTVPGQSCTYWIIIMTAVELGVRYGICEYSIIHDCTCYNDDIIVPSILYEIVCQLLELCGLQVNHDKSYTDDHPFRESCGYDVYDGDIVTTLYWPRRDISLDSRGVPTLISLQNKLYSLGAMKAANLISSVVKGILPSAPVGLPGSETTSLWDYKSNKLVKPVVFTKRIREERYLMLSVGYASNPKPGVWKYTDKVPMRDWPKYECGEPVLDEKGHQVNIRIPVSGHPVLRIRVTNEKVPSIPTDPTLGLRHAVLTRIVHNFYDICDSIWDFLLQMNSMVAYGEPVMLDELNVVRFDGYETLQGKTFSVYKLFCDPKVWHKDMWTRSESYNPEGLYRVVARELRPTYDNQPKHTRNVFAGSLCDQRFIESEIERFELEAWYKHGSQYPDDLCELLGVTQNSRRIKRLVTNGFKTVQVSSLEASPEYLAQWRAAKEQSDRIREQLAEKEKEKKREERINRLRSTQ